ncbi:MAG: bifunctional DNA primase/polymerase, partial [Paracoccaceae bacterium]
MTRSHTRPEHDRRADQVAGGRPIGVGHPTYSSAAATLLDNGYEPLPIVPAKKQPPMRGWSSVPIDARQVEDWVARYPDHGVGLRTGQLVGLDIDILDADLAHEIQSLAIRRLGDSFVRVGRWPKRLLLYRTDHPAPKRAVGKVEVLGAGQQLVAFGVHPDTGQPYSWTSGDSPLDAHVSDLPSVDDDAIAAFLAEAGALQPDAGQSGGSRPRRSSQAAPNPGHVTREGGLVLDGRDGWLSTIAFHAVHDASDAEITPDLDDLAAHVWDRFSDTTDLTRLRQDSGRGYDLADARRKVAEKLRLLSDGRLPERAPQDAPPPPECPTTPVESARAALDQTIHKACTDILGWHRSGMDTAPPRIGIRATVGLGKTTLSRRHLLALRAVLKQEGLPHRIAIFTPSLALAEEAAEGWQGSGLTVAVLRGYEALQPVSRDRMCLDIEAVRLALTAGADIQKSVCDAGKGNRCAHIQGCAKQANRRDVAGAD